MTADPQWFANKAAVFADVISGVALIVSVMSVWYARAQARAAGIQAVEATRSRELSEHALGDQAQALLSQAENTAVALALAARSAAAAEESAKIAEQSIVQAREATQRSLRAYVTIDQILPLDQNADKAPREVSITVVNTGLTPARHLQVHYRVALLVDIPNSFAQYEEHYRTWMPTDIGRDQRRTVYGHFIGRDELLAGVADHSSKLIVHGGVRYTDMFSDEERLTEFCFIWDVHLLAFFPAGPANNVM
jgi:hypothetical protein